ncbi:MAG: hypothetical protein K2Q17_01045 [Nitrospiraceae bacterium]|nr:hypothetical protein [Nitrospiraceae bacterium]
MITTHSIADYREALYNFLISPPIEGFRQGPYFDSKGLVTIGTGFNIETDGDVLRYVLNQLGVFVGKSDQAINAAVNDFQQAIVGGEQTGTFCISRQSEALMRG